MSNPIGPIGPNRNQGIKIPKIDVNTDLKKLEITFNDVLSRLTEVKTPGIKDVYTLSPASLQEPENKGEPIR